MIRFRLSVLPGSVSRVVVQEKSAMIDSTEVPSAPTAAAD